MLKPDIIVIGASAGGLKAFETIVSQLPSNFPAAVFIVWHISPDSPSILAEILAKHTPLRVKHASGKEWTNQGFFNNPKGRSLSRLICDHQKIVTAKLCPS